MARERFRRFALQTSQAMGSPWAFATALFVVLGWLVTGPVFRWSDTWQLIINTATTIVTFLMVFLIQATQNRDAKAIQLKLDELLRAVHGAREDLEDLEDATEDEVRRYENEFRRHH